jgi:hypothetical protein
MTPWGKTTVVEEVKIEQRAGDKRFASLVQLLEDDSGELFVRLAYSTGGAARRGPVTLRVRDIHRLRQALGDESRLAPVLGLGGGDA